jgi:hypothetical protein
MYVTNYAESFEGCGPVPFEIDTVVVFTDSVNRVRAGNVLGYRAAYERALVATPDGNIDVATAKLSIPTYA